MAAERIDARARIGALGVATTHGASRSSETFPNDSHKQLH
jgi:hypothetical protein